MKRLSRCVSSGCQAEDDPTRPATPASFFSATGFSHPRPGGQTHHPCFLRALVSSIHREGNGECGRERTGAIEREVGKLLNVVRLGLSRQLSWRMSGVPVAGQGQATGFKLAVECRGESTSRARGGCTVHTVSARLVLGRGGTAACTCVAQRPRPGAGRAAAAFDSPGARMRIHLQLDRSVGADRWLAPGASCCGLELFTRHRCGSSTPEGGQQECCMMVADACS
jgi:hypothetical protein